ncbi:MAG: hypothetical protein AAGF11_30095 [Myxococcota bacterium]
MYGVDVVEIGDCLTVLFMQQSEFMKMNAGLPLLVSALAGCAPVLNVHTGDISIRIKNESVYSFCSMYIYPKSAGVQAGLMGAPYDWLGGERLSPGGQVTVGVKPSYYIIAMRECTTSDLNATSEGDFNRPIQFTIWDTSRMSDISYEPTRGQTDDGYHRTSLAAYPPRRRP